MRVFVLCLVAPVVPLDRACADPRPILLSTKSLLQIAPNLSSKVAENALQSINCATRDGQPAPANLALIDYSLPSTEPRFWLINLEKRKLVLEELVAHGRGSGENFAQSFSNIPGSFSSSLGLYRISQPYVGVHGPSIRLIGLEPGINDRAYERAIVIHGASYVGPEFIATHQRLGRSWGCPALSPQAAKKAIKCFENAPSFLFVHAPDTQWLKSSPYLNKCQKQSAPS